MFFCINSSNNSDAGRFFIFFLAKHIAEIMPPTIAINPLVIPMIDSIFIINLLPDD